MAHVKDAQLHSPVWYSDGCYAAFLCQLPLRADITDLPQRYEAMKSRLGDDSKQRRLRWMLLRDLEHPRSLSLPADSFASDFASPPGRAIDARFGLQAGWLPVAGAEQDRPAVSLAAAARLVRAGRARRTKPSKTTGGAEEAQILGAAAAGTEQRQIEGCTQGPTAERGYPCRAEEADAIPAR